MAASSTAPLQAPRNQDGPMPGEIQGYSKVYVLDEGGSLTEAQAKTVNEKFQCTPTVRNPRKSRQASLPPGARELSFHGNLKDLHGAYEMTMQIIKDNKVSGAANNSAEVRAANRAKQMAAAAAKRQSKFDAKHQRSPAPTPTVWLQQAQWSQPNWGEHWQQQSHDTDGRWHWRRQESGSDTNTQAWGFSIHVLRTCKGF